MIRAARSDLARAEALERQASLDQDAAFTAKLAALRDLERQALLIREEILPAAERAAASARTSYQVGALELPALLAAEELVLEIRLLAAEARTGREVRLAELEVLAGRDVETLARTNEVSTVTSGRQS
jgi:hypothetical protein